MDENYLKPNTLYRDWKAYHIEFVMAPNLYMDQGEEPIGLGLLVENVCYRGADFAPLYNFKDVDGVVKVRARSKTFPAWEARGQFGPIKKLLLKKARLNKAIIEDFLLVKSDEPYGAWCERNNLPVPDCCKCYPYEILSDAEKGNAKTARVLRPWGYSWKDIEEIEEFCKKIEVEENEIRSMQWPTKEMITGTYPTYPKFT